MSRKRLTQIFPFLLPLRKWEKKQFFYMKMALDTKHYASHTTTSPLPYTVWKYTTPMINPNSGHDIQYQYNKAHNLQVAFAPMNGILIEPGETFSFWNLAQHAPKYGEYKEALVLSDGKIILGKGGGLCQLSGALYWTALHTPLTILERHSHLIEDFPSYDTSLPAGTDATVSEGWQDLRFQNNTSATYQILFSFKNEEMTIAIHSNAECNVEYTVYSENVNYTRKKGHIYQHATVFRTETNRKTNEHIEKPLYINHMEIGYELPRDIEIKEEL